jgi:hypothetical protein
MRLVIEARCARAGVEYSDEMARAMKNPWWGCNAGRAIAREADVTELWGVISEIRKRRVRFLRSIDAPPDHARAPSLPIPADETVPFGDPPRHDFRSPEESAAAAEAAWQDVLSACHVIDPLLMREVMATVIREERLPRDDLPALLRAIGKEMGVM